jgi:hypothetical protein
LRIATYPRFQRRDLGHPFIFEGADLSHPPHDGPILARFRFHSRGVPMSKKIYCLIKAYDSEEHAKAFINTGEMHCRTLKKFKEIEDDNDRRDEFEGTSHWFQAKDIKMSFTVRNGNDEVLNTVDIGEPDLAGPTVFQPTIFDGFNLFCMYAVVIEDFEESYSTEDEKKPLKEKINRSIADQIRIDSRYQNFGDYAVVICNVERFIEAVESHAKNNNMKICHRLVEYFDPETFTGSFKGVEAIFRKRKTYKYQNEFRFAFNANNETHGPITLNVGPLNEFGFIGPLKDIIERLKIEI